MRNILLFALISCINLFALAEVSTGPDLPVLQYYANYKTSLEDLEYKTAVHYWIENAYTSTKSRERAARGVGDEVLAKYDVLIDNIALDPNNGVPPATMSSVEFIDFTEAENTAQAWAFMGETAVPALTIVLNGKTSGHATASWRTQYKVLGSGQRSVSLKFRIPEAVMDGRFEFSGKGPHQGRVRVQLLVNGYPAWSSEAIRAAVKNPTSANQWEIDTFGSNWVFNQENANAKWVTAGIGNYSAGQTLDVTLLYFVEASVDEKCKLAADMYACMGMTIGFKRESVATFPTFTSGPVLSIAAGLLP